jgi:hypothetical protein
MMAAETQQIMLKMMHQMQKANQDVMQPMMTDNNNN